MREPAQDAERRRVIDAILHHRALAVGLERMLVPPDAVRSGFLQIDKASTGFPCSDTRAPANQQPSDADVIVDPRTWAIVGPCPWMENAIAAGVMSPRFAAFEKNANVSSIGAWTTVVVCSS